VLPLKVKRNGECGVAPGFALYVSPICPQTSNPDSIKNLMLKTRPPHKNKSRT
jgi:hypothetical protein